MIIKSMKVWRIVGSMALVLTLLSGMSTAVLAQPSLLQLAQAGSAEEIANAIRAGADVNAKDLDGTTALMLAAAFNEDVDAVKAIVEAGAEVNARDLNGVTPLMYAANFNSNPSVAKLLIEAGAKVNLKTVRQVTALMLASAANPSPEPIHILLDAGADSATRDEHGNTALDHAVKNPALQGTEAYERLLKDTTDRERAVRSGPVEREI